MVLKFTVANKVGSFAINVGRRRFSFAFNLGQFSALIASRCVYESEPMCL